MKISIETKINWTQINADYQDLKNKKAFIFYFCVYLRKSASHLSALIC